MAKKKQTQPRIEQAALLVAAVGLVVLLANIGGAFSVFDTIQNQELEPDTCQTTANGFSCATATDIPIQPITQGKILGVNLGKNTFDFELEGKGLESKIRQLGGKIEKHPSSGNTINVDYTNFSSSCSFSESVTDSGNGYSITVLVKGKGTSIVEGNRIGCQYDMEESTIEVTSCTPNENIACPDKNTLTWNESQSKVEFRNGETQLRVQWFPMSNDDGTNNDTNNGTDNNDQNGTTSSNLPLFMGGGLFIIGGLTAGISFLRRRMR